MIKPFIKSQAIFYIRYQCVISNTGAKNKCCFYYVFYIVSITWLSFALLGICCCFFIFCYQNTYYTNFKGIRIVKYILIRYPFSIYSNNGQYIVWSLKCKSQKQFFQNINNWSLIIMRRNESFSILFLFQTGTDTNPLSKAPPAITLTIPKPMTTTLPPKSPLPITSSPIAPTPTPPPTKLQPPTTTKSTTTTKTTRKTTHCLPPSPPACDSPPSNKKHHKKIYF